MAPPETLELLMNVLFVIVRLPPENMAPPTTRSALLLENVQLLTINVPE